VLIKSGLMKLQFKTHEFKAKIASNSTAIAQMFNAEITRFGCRSANHILINTSLARQGEWDAAIEPYR